MSNQPAGNSPSAAYYLTLIGGILGIVSGGILTITIILAIIGIWLVVANCLMIVFAQRLMAQPNEHSKYGLYILLLSIFSLNPICFIGSLIALTYQPTPIATGQPYQTYAPYQPYAQPNQYSPATTKYCPQCGNPVGGEAQYCPKCGTKIP
jgi:hypothetical protein